MSLRWKLPVEPSAQEKKVMARCKAKKLFVFLREHRHEIFDDAFQDELAQMYGEQPVGGSDAVAPALLAMVTILQAAFGVSDADAVEDAAMNRRWQLVLGCLGAEDAPFSQGTLQKFRLRLIVLALIEKRGNLDRRGLRRQKRGGVSGRHERLLLRAGGSCRLRSR